MSQTRQMVFRVMVLAGALALLSGCAAEATTTHPTTAPEVASTPAPVAVISFSGSDVRTSDAAGVELERIDFSSGVDPVIALLTDVIGEPTVAEIEEQCAGAQTHYQWDGLSLSDWVDGDGFVVSIYAATAGVIRVETTGRFAIGDDMSSALESFSDEDVARPDGGDAYVALDAVSRVEHGDYTSPVGAIGYLENSATLTSVITPGQWSSFLC